MRRLGRDIKELKRKRKNLREWISKIKRIIIKMNFSKKMMKKMKKLIKKKLKGKIMIKLIIKKRILNLILENRRN